jgi:hypothetical protein
VERSSANTSCRQSCGESGNVPNPRGRKHIVIPDTQIKPGLDLSHLDWIAQYVVDKRPDVLVLGGDWADMPSLSRYDKGKKSFEGRRYRDDILAANDGLQRLMAPIEAEMERIRRRHLPLWTLRKIITLGNHEDRINRAIEDAREFENTISTEDLHFKQWGFEVFPFLQQVEVDGVTYSHFFPSGPKGQPIGTARALLTKLHGSCFAFHLQGRDIAYGKRANGQRITGIICGSCYQHDEAYLGPQGNNVWRGLYVLNEVNDGSFDEMPVSLPYLKERYETRKPRPLPHAGHFKAKAETERGLDQSLPVPVPFSS